MKRRAPATSNKRRECPAPNCRKKIALKSKARLCARCNAKRWRENNPVAYFFNKLKYRAKERGFEFTLTLEQFRRFVTKHGIVDGRGKKRDDISIDRRCGLAGYHAWNLQPLPLGENARKQYVPYFRQKAEIDRMRTVEEEPAPFVADHYEWRTGDRPDARAKIDVTNDKGRFYPTFGDKYNSMHYKFWRYRK